eukprot:565486-Pyramimonas_sp.AAC.2
MSEDAEHGDGRRSCQESPWRTIAREPDRAAQCGHAAAAARFKRMVYAWPLEKVAIHSATRRPRGRAS